MYYMRALLFQKEKIRKGRPELFFKGYSSMAEIAETFKSYPKQTQIVL